MNPHNILESATQSLGHDVSQLTVDGTVVTGKYGLVSIDLQKAKVFVRRAPDQKPFCYINLPTRPGLDAMSKALMAPKLRGRMTLDMMDDLTAILLVYTSIRLVDTDLDLSAVRLSPEAETLFASTFAGSSTC